MAESLHKSIDSVNYMISRFGLSSPKSIWCDDEVTFLLENANKIPYTEIAKELGKSVRAVGNKLSNIRMASLIDGNLLDIEDGVKMRPSKERAILANQRALFKDRLFRSQKVDEYTSRLWRVM